VLGTIPIVDEEEDVQKSVRLTLTKAVYDVVDAEDGEKRVQKVRSGDNPITVDAILGDIHMAKVHNGEEAVAYFRQQFFPQFR
jgi:two-component system chemotaxis response regulator CheY